LNTVFLLLAEYESAHVPLERVATKYLGLTRKEAFSKANAHSLPFPALRVSGSRAPWMVDIRDVDEWLDNERQNARADLAKIRARFFCCNQR